MQKFFERCYGVCEGGRKSGVVYYPFGLTFNSFQRENSISQDYKYNGKEEQNELSLGWLDYGARMYQPDLGRFLTQDRYSEKYYPINPYQYGANNPLIFIDHKGDSLIKVTVNDESGYIKGENTLHIDHTVFGDVQDILNSAVETGTYIHINSSFRTNKKQEELNGSKDAITPASPGNSPHNAGLAIDFNVYTDNEVSKGLESGNKNLKSDNAFIKKVKGKGWRYGGDFKSPDRVHIDKRGTDDNFKSIRDANQKQVDGDNQKTVNDSKIKRTETITIKKKQDEK